jgi:hypothetical protein
VRRKGGADAPVTFFSFQDVMLSLIGITIVIAVILVLQITKRAVEAVEAARVTEDTVAPADERERILREQVAALEFAVREARKRPDVDPLARRATLRQELLGAAGRLEELEARAAELAKQLRDLTLQHPDAGAVVQATELMRRRDDLVAELETLERRRRISYIVDQATSARPILLEISATRIVACDLSADGAAFRIAAGTPAAQVNDAIEFYRTVAQGPDAYLLLVVKPSGVAQYFSLLGAIEALPESQRPRIGLDLVAESGYVSEIFPSATLEEAQ